MPPVMKTLCKLLMAVCLFSAVDADAELRSFSFNCDPQHDKNKVYTLEIEEGEVIRSTNKQANSSLEQYEHRFSNSRPNIEVEFERPDGKQVWKYRIDNFHGPIIRPAKIKFYYDEYKVSKDKFQLIYDFQKTSTSSSGGSTSNLPSNTVVIPTDASGPVEIIMESSKDLVNWTRAEPGTYGADTPKRFFRVRAVVKQ